MQRPQLPRWAWGAFLGVVVLGAVISWAFWATPWDRADEVPGVAGGMYAMPQEINGRWWLVPPTHLYDRGLAAEDVPTLVDPALVSVGEADAEIDDVMEGIALDLEGEERFYPFTVMNWHEVVEETIAGKRILITHSVLCGSSVVYDATGATVPTGTFSIINKVYNNCPLLAAAGDDRWWNQATGVAVAGMSVGDVLPRMPSQVMTWATWKRAHPNGKVLSTATGFSRDYRRHPYMTYDKSMQLLFPVNHSDPGVQVKDYILDVEHAGVHAGFARAFVAPTWNVNARVGTPTDSIPVVALLDNVTASVQVFHAAVNGEDLTFRRTATGYEDDQTHSQWTAQGACTRGALRGTQLVPAASARMFGFAYVAQYPDAELPGRPVPVVVEEPAPAQE